MTRKISATLLLLGLLALGGLAHAVQINVTTLTDEDNVAYGGNDTGCSLREAVQAAAQKVPYGGCTAGTGAGDIIQLEAGPYKLTPRTLRNGAFTYGPIVISSGVTLQGASTTSNAAVNLVTNTAPTQVAPITLILMKGAGSGQRNSRVFIVTSVASVGFVDVIIRNGKADNSDGSDLYGGNGGGVWAASTVSFNNVQIDGNTATGSGGAVFLAGNNTNLIGNIFSMTGNVAGSGGGAVGSTCYTSISLESHGITLQRSLVFNNKTQAHLRGYGALLLCGNVNESISDSTIAFNDIGINIDNSTTAINALVPGTVALAMAHVTVIGQRISGIDVANAQLTSFSMTNSVVAFNFPYVAAGSPAAGAPDNTNCYGTLPSSGVTVSFTGNKFGDNCSFTTVVSGDEPRLYNGNTTSIGSGVVNPNWGAQFYMPFGAATDPGSQIPPGYGGLVGGYFPKSVSASPTAVLVQATLSNCTVTDQRGAPRNAGGLGCTLGAIEPKALVPANDVAQNRAADGPARSITVSVLNNDVADEDGSGFDGARYSVDAIDGLPQCNYAGNGGHVQVSADQQKLTYYPDRPVVDGVLQPGQVTDISNPVVCNYRIRDSKAPNFNTSTVTASVTFSVFNISPVALSDSYTRPYDGNPFSFYPLSNDSDPDGVDGKLPASGASRGPQTSQLVPSDCAKRQLVEIVAQPSLGTITGKVMARVLSGSTVITYYDGQLTYRPRNSFSPFTDSFQYHVLDANCAASNSTSVSIAVAAPPDGGKSGGGSPDVILLVGGLALTGLRRFLRP
jgi:CSLREA domain-containing protein